MFFVRKKTRNSWIKQIQKKASNIIEKEDYSFIDHHIKDKRIILLGENSHGVADYFSAKIDIIRYLHKNHGYNVVVFESGLIEATMCKILLSNYSAKEKIQNCFLDIYHNEEMKPFFTENWAENLQICGMDIQPTYPLISEHMLEWIRNHIDIELYDSLKKVELLFWELDKEIMFKVTKHLKSRMKGVMKEYHKILHLIDSKRIEGQGSNDSRMFEVIHQGIRNRVQWLEVSLKGFLSSGIFRGRLMYENLEWLMNNYYKGEKVIVWAHNFHIRKTQTFISKIFGIKSVGYWLQQNYPNDFYSIGFYAGSGTFATQLRVELEIDAEKKNHLESLLNEATKQNIFLPLNLTGEAAEKNIWFNRKWWLLESGLMGLAPKIIYPNDHYDALLFFKDVHPPLYFTRNVNEEEME
ncbi:erythromycin esterase family protein [Bacillus massilinigeriensis]|uniref:erythromycin esterase family protein n=1 Tax=Bacillus mediterraneensis TaxID=1805474 RepID=UPI0008F8D2E8|nr:erythromycin esterase family protein [Bacillus mediterraneensis]